MNIDKEFLIDKSKEAMQNSYSPYSGFKVGAALLCADGSVYTGCNIENSSYSLTQCAERTAVFKAVSDNKKDFDAIAISACDKDGGLAYAMPCGACRQVIAEFCGEEFLILIAAEKVKEFTLGELLPNSFDFNTFI